MTSETGPLVGYDLRAAREALARLLQNPDDTQQVFRILRALPGRSGEWVLARMDASRTGRGLLAERPEILPRLLDRDALRRAPRGSLAHAYLAFVEREGITADGLVAASVEGGSFDEAIVHPRARDLDWMRRRLRDSHDLWHAATGYAGDLIGEGALLAFSLVQLRSPGILVIISAGFAKGRTLGLRGEIAHGLYRGWSARWLPAVRWEDLLSLPLADVRRRLALPEPRRYTEVRPADLGLGASLA